MGRLDFNKRLNEIVNNTNNHTNLLSIVKYSKPKICHFNYDLSRDWYVYYSYDHPIKKTPKGKTKRIRQPNIYCKSKQFDNVKDRLRHVKLYQKALYELLKEGYSPYETEEEKTYNNITNSINFALELKSNVMSKNTFRDYKGKITRFLNYYKSENSINKSIKDISRADVNKYLNKLLKETSARNRNNMRGALYGIFKVLENNDYVEKNIIESIEILKTIENKNKVYKDSQVVEIFNYLEKEDPVLLLFIKFVFYNFLREVEVCRIKYENIDFKKRLIIFKAKNKAQKIKIIPNVIWNEIKNLEWSYGDYLFTPDGMCKPSNTAENNRRDYFSKRFKKIVKDKFNLSKEYTMYGMRHTAITRMYKNLIKDFSQDIVFSKIMLITGHKTKDALLKYLRDIDAILPEDYSDLLK